MTPASGSGTDQRRPTLRPIAPSQSMNFEVRDAARLRRDKAFDGLFFTAVRTTRIYCRPICPARPAATRNVRFFASAAAAEAAGYRPCLRCRPEVAPWCPAWNGTKSTVERALKLIERGALDRGSTDELAKQLGIGPRHLLRLFRQHLDASPVQVATSLRVRRAKRLLSETTLPIVQVAFEAGFGSVRRFNAVFSSVYGMAPSAIRRPKTLTP
jgi:AraC family transcriptional regulator, regulatory protein of adaptative response / methylated-DNA-[protein]-cysteine methyltransferase